MNKNKFCFIICTNSQMFFDENMRYIEQLVIPEGFEVDVIGITDAKSMAEGYNEGMKASDAQYKIYMHQDVFILYPYFLQSVLDIFASDNQIGMIGMVGTEKMPADGVMWHNSRRGNLYETMNEQYSEQMGYDTYQYRIADGLWNVEAVDGCLMITSKDILWREDIFDAWDFYDVSQCFEMIRVGYKVVVPEQELPWCIHDDGIWNLWSYDKYRKICLMEYSEFFEIVDEEAGQSAQKGSVIDKYEHMQDTNRINLEIVINTKLNEEHKKISDLFEDILKNKSYEVVVIDLNQELLPHEKTELIKKKNPKLLVTFDMAGFELRTLMERATYNAMPYRMAHILWKKYEDYSKWLEDAMNFSMFFYGAECLVEKIHKKHPEIEHVQSIELRSISECIKQPLYIEQLVEQIIKDTELEMDY